MVEQQQTHRLTMMKEFQGSRQECVKWYNGQNLTPQQSCKVSNLFPVLDINGGNTGKYDMFLWLDMIITPAELDAINTYHEVIQPEPVIQPNDGELQDIAEPVQDSMKLEGV